MSAGQQTDQRVYVHGNPVPLAGFSSGNERRVLVRFAGPIKAAWKRLLARSGVTTAFFCPPLGACLNLPRVSWGRTLGQRFPFIVAAADYGQMHCQRFDPSHGVAIQPSPLPKALHDVVCFSPKDRQRVARELARLGVRILGASNCKLRVSWSGQVHILRDVVGVKLVDQVRLPRLASSVEMAAAVALLPALASVSNSGCDGAGEVVAVADTGLDRGVNDQTLHADFRGRVKTIESWPMNPSWEEFADSTTDDAADRDSGHGTHVAGLALGSGAASRGLHQGIAPAAQLVFQAIERNLIVKSAYRAQFPSGYYLAGRPLDLRDLYLAARKQGARIHVNSWGDAANGAYTDDCYETDLFLHEHQDAVVLFAAGNDGADRDSNQRIDPSSLYAPASAKSVLCVGATEGPLVGKGSRATWGDFDKSFTRWRVTGDRRDPVSGEPTRIAPFSSTGPTRDGRIKPELCAPGTNLPAPRSQATSFSGWGMADPLPYYMYDGGTSMATAVAGGAMAVIRQAWRSARKGAPPTGPALKALAVLGTLPVASRAPGRNAGPDEAGFGRMQIARSLPAKRELVGRVLRSTFIADRRRGLGTGGTSTNRIKVKAATSGRFVLCWYDYPGERLINALDLEVVLPNGTLVHGNTGFSNLAPSGRDECNTVLVVDVGPLDAGVLVVRVRGINVPAGPQKYALVWALAEPS